MSGCPEQINQQAQKYNARQDRRDPFRANAQQSGPFLKDLCHNTHDARYGGSDGDHKPDDDEYGDGFAKVHFDIVQYCFLSYDRKFTDGYQHDACEKA